MFVQTADTILISVNIDSRPLKLRVAAAAEDDVKTAANMLNKKIDAFRNFSQEPLDRISWAALDLAGDVVKNAKNPTSHIPSPTLNMDGVNQELDSIEQLLNLR